MLEREDRVFVWGLVAAGASRICPGEFEFRDTAAQICRVVERIWTFRVHRMFTHAMGRLFAKFYILHGAHGAWRHAATCGLSPMQAMPQKAASVPDTPPTPEYTRGKDLTFQGRSPPPRPPPGPVTFHIGVCSPGVFPGGRGAGASCSMLLLAPILFLPLGNRPGVRGWSPLLKAHACPHTTHAPWQSPGGAGGGSPLLKALACLPTDPLLPLVGAFLLCFCPGKHVASIQ